MGEQRPPTVGNILLLDAVIPEADRIPALVIRSRMPVNRYCLRETMLDALNSADFRGVASRISHHEHLQAIL